jgi:mRNA interferase MazF
MGKFVKGDIVVLPFPFSDLTAFKSRPAFVVTSINGDDFILCMITSKNKSDIYSIPLSMNDFDSGKLDQASYIRPNRLFTADGKIIKKCAGKLSPSKTNEVIEKIIQIVRS